MTLDENAERAAFEQWYHAYRVPLDPDWAKRDDDGDYENYMVDFAWSAWRERARRP